MATSSGCENCTFPYSYRMLESYLSLR